MLAGRFGLAATAVSIAATLAVAAAGPSVMEPVLPGRPGQPPWSASLHLPAYLAVALTAVALATGAAGLGLCLYAGRRGWRVRPRVLLVMGLLAAAALAVLPPFGSSDHLSYAAYGRMTVTGHDPYTTTPAALAGLGDPVARAVQDWRHSPSVYGSLATAAQALASLIGGGSARLTVFVLSVLGAAAFAVTGLVLHLLARGSRDRQLRAALLWTCNPLLLQLLVAGAHVDVLAVAFAVTAVALFRASMQNAPAAGHRGRAAALGAGAGVAAGLAFAVKVSYALVPLGLVAAAAFAWRARRPAGRPARAGPARPGGPTAGVAGNGLVLAAGAMAAGFAVTAALSFLPWGLESLGPALRAGSYASFASPWRGVRAALSPLAGEPAADTVIKVGAVVLALAVAALFARPLAALARAAPGVPGGADDAVAGAGPAAPATAGGGLLPAAAVFAVMIAWLAAWPYVLPWYDGLVWAMLAALPWLPGPWAAMDWLLLARTTALAFGYLPARGVAMPAGLGWLRSVVRTDITPVALLAVLAVLIVVLWPLRGTRADLGVRTGAPGAV
jgi:hypothetical protein